MLTPTTLTIATAALFCAVVAAPLKADDDKRTISVSASGEVTAAPDRASIEAGIVTEDSSAKAALAGNSKKMQAVIDGLKAAGVEARDIQTSRFDISPVYDRPKNGKPSIQGYRASNIVHLTVRDVGKLGDLIDKMVSLGANQIDSIQFEVSDLETRLDDARRQAMRNAIRRATLYAQAAGASLGNVLTISEQTSHPPRPYETRRMGRVAASAAPIAPGEMDIDVTVNVTWALK